MTQKRALVGAGNSHFVAFSTCGGRRLLSAAAAREIVMAELDGLAKSGRVKVSGFAIMPDHVHALLEIMKVRKTVSARRLRKLYEDEMPRFGY